MLDAPAVTLDRVAGVRDALDVSMGDARATLTAGAVRARSATTRDKGRSVSRQTPSSPGSPVDRVIAESLVRVLACLTAGWVT
jgi:hypothetical protein